MAVTPLWEVDFVIKKSGSGGIREQRRAQVAAANAHPATILAVLNSNISVLSTEVVEILAVHSAHTGTEGASILS